MKKIKICHLSSVHSALDTRIFHKEVKTLVDAGYDVTLIAQHDKEATVNGAKIIPLPKPRNRFWRMLGSFRLLRLALSQKAEVYHFHDPELIPVAVLLKLISRKRIIYDVHEDVPKQILSKEWLPSYFRSFVSRLFAFGEGISFPLFDAVVAAGEDITGHLPHSSKVVVIRNFASLKIARQTGEKHRRKRDSEPAVLIYVGVLSEDRGAKEMVKAVSYLEGRARLVLVGTFSEPRLERKLREEASKEVQFVGQVPYEKVFSFLRKADIGLICFQPTPNNMAASWRNNKLFEYMATGLPVIASNFPAWKEIVEGNNCGLTTNPLNSREIAKAVEYLINYPQERRKMGETGRKAVVEKYNWETESKKLISVYDNLLKGK